MAGKDDELGMRLERLLERPMRVGEELAAADWERALAGVDRRRLLLAVLEVVRGLVLPGWAASRPHDRRLQRALAAVHAWLAAPSADAAALAKCMAKACTAARRDSLGYEHRVAEAARGVAEAVGARDLRPLFDALVSVEAELQYRLAVDGEYTRAPEVRRTIVDTLRSALAEVEIGKSG